MAPKKTNKIQKHAPVRRNKHVPLHRRLAIGILSGHSLPACIFFETAFRLRHYSLFPYLQITPEQIDTEAINFWKTHLPKNLKKPYLQLKNIIMPAQYKQRFLRNHLPEPQRPIQWFFTLYLHYASGTELPDASLLAAAILQDWRLLSPEVQHQYARLASINEKYCQALKIESFMNSRGFTVGFTNPSPDSLTIQTTSSEIPCKLISTLLNKAFSKLSQQLIELFPPHSHPTSPVH